METRYFNYSTTMNMNIMNNKISVLISAYNSGKYIAECIESVMTQTYQNLEIIIVETAQQTIQNQLLKAMRWMITVSVSLPFLMLVFQMLVMYVYHMQLAITSCLLTVMTG